MAQKVNVILVSDMSGEELTDGETVVFGLDGTQYEMDLSKKEADKFRGLFQDHIAVARKVGRKSGGTRKAAQTGTPAAEIRAWAQSNGIEVPDRGRIPQDVRDKFEAAN